MKYFWMQRFISGCYSNGSRKMIPSIGRQLSSGAVRSYSVAPMIKVEPTRGLIDEPVKLEIVHLVPNQQVTLQSRLLSEEADWWEAYAHYVSDSEGIVRVTRDESLGGTYTGREPMGLIWSMMLAPGSRPSMRLRKKDVTVPYLVTISVYNGWISSNFDKQAVLASVVLERFYMAPGTTRLEIKEHHIIGTMFFPPGSGPFPAVLDMWGGGGGLVEYRAALLASRGFATFALAYLGHKGVPQPLQTFDSKLSYFEEAFNALNNHPKVAKGRVALLGLSLGFTLALLMATRIPNIHVDKIRCPLMLIFGEDDQNWPAAESAIEIQKMMKNAGKDHLLTTISYPQAGHLIEPPYSPHCRESKFRMHSLNRTVTVLWGGEAKPHSDAQEDSWKKILAFLEKHLVLQHPAAIAQSKL
ncbi:peroxisomal succinyl-coenzyme A thioesterase-like isoform X2 [Heterodontus francisci]|uniref:peroxisomal succinyl-coenzyme A thioesterase-like isoform X2 n=1 Tax=Heterodontus francisci TaxID=7792 RepID=UPI00355C1F2D